MFVAIGCLIVGFIFGFALCAILVAAGHDAARYDESL